MATISPRCNGTRGKSEIGVELFVLEVAQVPPECHIHQDKVPETQINMLIVFCVGQDCKLRSN